MKSNPRMQLLAAEDDPEDQEFLRSALLKAGAELELTFVEDGEELLEYLREKGRYSGAKYAGLPRIILLELILPGPSGKDALSEIRADPGLKEIPVIIFTDSRRDEDRQFCEELKVEGYIYKPNHFDEWVNLIKDLYQTWFVPEPG